MVDTYKKGKDVLIIV
jgi:hypothetical protein